MTILEVHNLKKVYTTRFGGNQVQALRNIQFSVPITFHILFMTRNLCIILYVEIGFSTRHGKPVISV